MGNDFSNCLCKKVTVSTTREITLLMIGLDNAGKTCTVKHLLGESTADAVPTIGFSTMTLKHGKFAVTIFDLGGGPKIRGIWKKYFALVHGLIFVVDASDSQRLEECKTEIKNVLQHDKIAGKPMLMLVNKQDISGSIDETELVSRLDLEALVNEQKCPTRVETSCAIYDGNGTKDPGIQEGFSWLIGIISRDFNALNRRVSEEVSEQKRQEKIEQAERMKRVQRIREERERQSQNETKLEPKSNDCDEDEEDVIVGNPFKPSHVIKAELEEKKRRKESRSTTPTVRVIHVSPTNSEERTNREEVILLPQPLPLQPLNNISESGLSSHSMTMCNGNNVSALATEDEDSKKKSKKSRKHFKNRIVPQVPENSSLPHISRMGELPPLRPNSEAISNGQPCVYISPKKTAHKNGKINWQLAEELELCKETSLTGGSSHRFEAW